MSSVGKIGPEARFKNFQQYNPNIQRPYLRYPTVRKKFGSALELVSFATSAPCLWTNRTDSRDYDATGWSGTTSWTDAVRLAEEGYPEARDRIVEVLDIDPEVRTAATLAIHYDYSGGWPDVPRFVSGDPECMADIVHGEKLIRPIIRMAVSPVTIESTLPTQIQNWGIALVSLVDALEATGRRVEIQWISVSSQDDVWTSEYLAPYVVIEFPLKSADQHLDVGRLAFWTMHPAAQRRMQFAIKERLPIAPWYDMADAFGYGQAASDSGIKTFLETDMDLVTVGTGANTVKEGIGRIRASLRLATDVE